MRDLFATMEKAGGAIPPILFLQILHMAFPRFSEKTDQGVFAQQVSQKFLYMCTQM